MPGSPAPKGASSSRTKSPNSARKRTARDNAPPLGGRRAGIAATGVGTDVPAPTTVVEGCDTHQGTTPAALVTRRLWRRMAHRSTEFAPAPGTIGGLLDSLADDVQRVYLVGTRPGAGTAAGFRSWVFGELPEGWVHDARGHYLESSESPVLRYALGKRRVEVHRAASWFGEGAYSVDDARDAYDATRTLIEGAFEGCTLVGTPATTGRELFVHTIPRGHEYPVLSAELQELIRATSGQHRYDPTDAELGARGGTLPGLFELDGRFMFAGCAWGGAVGVPTRDTCDTFAGGARARYRVTFTVPREWPHLGILGVREPGGRWVYPRAPRATGETWADGCAVELALKHGWRVVIHERIIWATGKPLDAWADRLVRVRESVTGGDRVSALVRGALRRLVLTSIGAFWGTAAAVTHEAPLSAGMPRGEHVDNLRAEGAFWVWTERGDQGWAALAHPEWSAHVWALAQRRLLDAPTGTKTRAGVLHVDPATVVALRADAVYLTEPPAWPDDGRSGRFRLVRAVRRPIPCPASHAELLRARGGLS